MKTIAFYVSGHGFGHASRAIEVMNALLAQRPALRIVVRTTAPKWLFERTAGLSHGPSRLARVSDEAQDFRPAVAAERSVVEYHHVQTDTGIVQIDSLRLDETATINQTREFMRTFQARQDDEVAFLQRTNASMVVADVPALGIAAASAARLPGIILANFTWDWIYSIYPGGDDIVRAIGDVYARADLALRLPMHGGFATCSNIVDLPFVARQSARDPMETRCAMGFPLDERLVLVSFGGYGLPGLDLDALSRLEGYVALVGEQVGGPVSTLSPPRPSRNGSLLRFDEGAMYDAGLRYEDVVRAVDVVVSKPGYGIIAECLANEAALLYTSRGNFIEYDVLVSAMPRFLRTTYIDHDSLFAGVWTDHLDALLAQPTLPERPGIDGASIAAARLLNMI